MRFDSTRFPAAAKSTGFDAGNLEKVLRLPFALTSFVMRNVRRQKNAAERLLADREKLEV